jgi:multidrug efflux pump subunit AcrA (membrane-fusion protein)
VPLELKENVLVIPTEAAQTDGEEPYVWLVRGSSVQRRVVKLGVGDGTYTEVLDGLREGDVVKVPLRSPPPIETFFVEGG